MRIRSRDLIALAKANADRASKFVDPKEGLRLDDLTRVLDWTIGGVRSSDGPKVSGGSPRGLDSQIINDDDGDGEEGTNPKTPAFRNRKDPHAAWIQTLIADLMLIDQAMTRLEATRRRLSVLSAEEARRLAEASDLSRGQFCVNPACKMWITGIGDDRARDGRCDACRKFRDRRRAEGHPLEDRPHRLVHREPLQGCTDCARVYSDQVAS